MKAVLIPIAAITAIAGVVIVALMNGINGAVLMSGIGIIGGIGGYTLKAVKNRKV